jgi:uncharacterized protein YjbI with pentapeptide repeats
VRKGRVVRFLWESGLIRNASAIVDLGRAWLREADLSGANLADADLSWASLIGSNLSNADLAGASLGDAYLGEANLRGAYMSGSYMSGAYLEDAKGVTNEELEQHAYSLEGATMPDGLKYEDWLEEKEGREEDWEDSSPY